MLEENKKYWHLGYIFKICKYWSVGLVFVNLNITENYREQDNKQPNAITQLNILLQKRLKIN